MTHILARQREKISITEKAKLEQIAAENKRLYEEGVSNKKQASDLRFIGSQLIFVLESFAVICADIASDKGKEKENDDPRSQVVIIPTVEFPEISISGVEGDWRALRAWDMYRIMELPVILMDARTHITNCSENLFYGSDSTDLLRIRSRYITPLGLRASSLARRLRKQCDFPESPLSEGPYSATLVLFTARKCHVKHGLSDMPE